MGTTLLLYRYYFVVSLIICIFLVNNKRKNIFLHLTLISYISDEF